MGLETPVQLRILITGCQELSWGPYFLEPPSGSLLRGSQWPYGGQSDRRAYANLEVSSYSYPKCTVGRVNAHVQQCLLAPLAQLAKGQDKRSPGSENCQRKSQTPSAHHGCSSQLYQGGWQGLTSPSAPHMLCNPSWPQDISGLKAEPGGPWVDNTSLAFDPTHPHPSPTFARNVV